MSGSVDPGQLIRFFQRLAQFVGASAVIPVKDGSLLYRFKMDTGHGEIFHSPVPRPEGRRHSDFEGSFFPQGVNDRDFQRFLSQLCAVRKPLSPGTLYPLAFREQVDEPIVLDGDFVDRHLYRYLRAGQTSWGPFLYTGAEGRSGTETRLVFEGGPGRLVIALLAKTEVDAEGQFTAGPLTVRVMEDSRPSDLARSFEGSVENYLLYALNRALDPGQPIRTGSGSADRQAPGKESGPLEDMLTLTMAHRDTKASRIGENLDETPEDGFFLEPFLRQIGTQETLGTFLDADEGLAVVVHSDRECATKLAWIRETSHARFMYARRTPVPTSMPRRKVHWLEPTQFESIMGAEGKLRKGLEEAIGDEKTKLVAMMGTCVGDLTGLDYEGIIEQASSERRVPVVMVNQMLEHFMEIDDIWVQLFQIVNQNATPEPGLLNFLGYAPAGSAFAVELEACLEEMGLRVNGILVPSFRTPAVEAFLEASRTLVNTAKSAQFECSKLRESLGEMHYQDLEPPFGPAACKRFYQALRSFAPEGGSDGVESFWQPHEADWESFRLRALEHQVAILLRPQDLIHMLDPNELHGIDLVSLLQEMGFAVELMTIDGRVPGGADLAAERLLAHLPSAGESNSGLSITSFAGVQDPARALAESKAELVFSEYAPDHRILKSGKMFFHPRDFELGLAGAVRTIARLTRLAESGFLRAYDAAAAQGALRP